MANEIITAEEVKDLAVKMSAIDKARDVCNPHGSWDMWKQQRLLVTGKFVFADGVASVYPAAEGLAYKLFVNFYLAAQGWRR